MYAAELNALHLGLRLIINGTYINKPWSIEHQSHPTMSGVPRVVLYTVRTRYQFDLDAEVEIIGE